MFGCRGDRRIKARVSLNCLYKYILCCLKLAWFVVHTVAGKAVLAALTFPMILEFLPILLPRHFCGLLNMVHGQRETEENNGMDGEEVHFQDQVLTKLHEILKNEPWKLGFSRVSNVKQGKKCGYYI